MTPASIAIIGAGLAGLSCAQQLTGAGIKTCLFDKARGPGGRLSSRRRSELTFDLGAQYLTASSTAFEQQLLEWQQQGCILPWPVTSQQPAWVATPRMSALSRHLSQSLILHTQTRIQRLLAQPENLWVLVDEANNHWGPFTHLVIATPATQAKALVVDFPELTATLSDAEEEPKWVAYFALTEQLTPEHPVYQPHEGPLQRATLLNAKPGQATNLQRWVVEATPEWSQEQVNASPEGVAELLYKEWLKELNLKAPEKPLILEAHRWLYAQTQKPLEKDFLVADNQQVFVCGDYCRGQSLEAAWQSGTQLGKVLRKTIQ
ncbi:hypothetical protein SAMN05660443_2126 [Marinospirillum celere]|uniref:Amine oxidase domain-containing protein n=1 Tax=Marinospirillum celere TaxID=1122252 RepID=A0A1I1I0U0_9GAMM|nr:FAD-dependent oxidoreductase [Marinospirillum celere]SFC29776.1 hypothetical protein SAMN05660443_2126 [Marinospirillum celere]